MEAKKGQRGWATNQMRGTGTQNQTGIRLTPIEAIAVVFGLLAVWLTVRQHIACWPAGLVQVTLYVWIFYQVRLYSDLILHVIYIGVQIYGWYHWLHGGRDRSELPVTRLTATETGFWSAAALAGTAGWGYLMATTTDAAVPYGDAFTTAASLVAMWLQARKKLESWWFWIAVDVVAIVIYWYKALYLTSGLYLVFLGLCIAGIAAWKKTLVPAAAV